MGKVVSFEYARFKKALQELREEEPTGNKLVVKAVEDVQDDLNRRSHRFKYRSLFRVVK